MYLIATTICFSVFGRTYLWDNFQAGNSSDYLRYQVELQYKVN